MSRSGRARFTRLTPTTYAAAGLSIALLLVATVGPGLWGAAAASIDTSAAYQGPSGQAWLGTDALGRDVLLRTLVATRLSLELALAAAAVAAVIGIPVGAITGVLGPRARAVIGRLIQLGLALPALLVALFVVAIVGRGIGGATVAIGLAFAPLFARVAQTLAAGVADSEYVAAARITGVGRLALVWRYILPNTAEPLILQTGLTAGLALLTISALSFVGLGVQPPNYDWGRVLNDGIAAVYISPLAAIVPGVAITIAGLAFSFIGETFAHMANPVRRASDLLASSPAERTSIPGRRPEEDDASSAARTASRSSQPLLKVKDLHVRFPRRGQWVEVVRGVSLEIWPGEIVGLVGESGSGKSMTALALASLVPVPGVTTTEMAEFDGQEMGSLDDDARSRLLATNLAIVFQDPLSALNPALRVGIQLTEKLEIHQNLSRRDAMKLAEERLTQTHIGQARYRLGQYPHEFSGGMRQRAMIAMGLMTRPALMIADEPTTALDVTVQAQIIDLLREVNERYKTAILFISHDLAVVSELCSRILVLYEGLIVEELPIDGLSAPAHPYTRALLGSVTDLDTDRAQPLVSLPTGTPTWSGVGCPFAPRCPEALPLCKAENPVLASFASGRRRVACWARIADGTVSTRGVRN